MKEFKTQIQAFASAFDISSEEAEKMLRENASKWSGCLACENSRPGELEENPTWILRKCIFGTTEKECGALFQSIPFESTIQSIRLDGGLRDRALAKAELVGITSLNGLVVHLLKKYTR